MELWQGVKMAKITKTKMTFAVTIEVPAGVNIPMVREHILEAITCYESASLDVGGPLAKINLDLVRVHLTKKETFYG